MGRITVLVVALAIEAVGGLAAQSPMPDADRFLAETRKRLASNAVLQNRFMFRERVTELRLNPLGRLGTGPTEVFEVYPVQGSEMIYRRLVERDGKPLPRSEVAEQDREFLARYSAWRRQLAQEGQNERDARLRKQAEEQARDRKQAAEVTELFVFALEKRDVIDGQPAIVVSFKPKPNARPQSREGRVASSFAGRAWVHEHEHEVMRVEAEATSDVTLGWGLIARLHRGATALLTRAKVNDTWLPVQTKFNGTGRALLFRKAVFNFTREYSDYRPFDQAQLSALLAASSRSNR